MEIDLAHDYLTQRGGAERVALTIAERLPISKIFTAVYNPTKTFSEFEDYKIVPSVLQRVPTFRADPRLALPFLPAVWSRIATDSDIVLASSSGWAHAIRTKPEALKVVYCHNPARWIYQPDHYFARLPGWVRPIATSVTQTLRKWDRRQAKTADVYIANSSTVAKRVTEFYGIEPHVINPPVSIDPLGQQDPDPTLEGKDYWLAVARARAYKNIDVLVEAVQRRKDERLVIVGSRVNGHDNMANVTWTGRVSDARLRWLYANARALVSVSFEDFGLTPLEANSFGTPALLLRAGGFLDSLDEGISGSWIERPDPDAVTSAMRNFTTFDRERVRRHADKFSATSFVAQLQQVIATYRPFGSPTTPLGSLVEGDDPPVVRQSAS